MPSDEKNVRYDNWPIEGKDGTDVEWIGFMAKGKAPAGLYEPHEQTFYEADVDEENQRFVPVPDSERPLEEDETLGDLIAEIGDAVGWERLSEFGDRSHNE